MANGFLRLDKRIFETKSWSRGALVRGIIISLLEKAQWKDSYFLGDLIPRGSFAVSMGSLADEFKVHRTWLHNQFKKLEEDGFIIRKNMHNRYTLIIIVNYDSYMMQYGDVCTTETTTPTTTATTTVTTHNKNIRIKEYKKEKDISKDISKKKNSFVIPSLSEIENYISSINAQIDPQYFFDHYTANGWKVGSHPMKDWQATIRNWSRRNAQHKPQPKQTQKQTYEETMENQKRILAEYLSQPDKELLQ